MLFHISLSRCEAIFYFKILIWFQSTYSRKKIGKKGCTDSQNDQKLFFFIFWIKFWENFFFQFFFIFCVVWNIWFSEKNRKIFYWMWFLRNSLLNFSKIQWKFHKISIWYIAKIFSFGDSSNFSSDLDSTANFRVAYFFSSL